MKEKYWALYSIQLFRGLVCVYIRRERAQSRRLLFLNKRLLKGVQAYYIYSALSSLRTER